jgi:hypothetical protein
MKIIFRENKLSSAWFCTLLFIAVSLPVIARSHPGAAGEKRGMTGSMRMKTE